MLQIDKGHKLHQCELYKLMWIIWNTQAKPPDAGGKGVGEGRSSRRSGFLRFFNKKTHFLAYVIIRYATHTLKNNFW